jgi:hypothetical protein
MRRPYLFVSAVALAAVGVTALTVDAGSPYPNPPTTTNPGAIEPGSCRLEGHDLPPGPEAVDVVNLVFYCQLGDDSHRLFTFPVAVDDQATVLTLAEVLERLGPLEDDDEFRPQFGPVGFAGAIRPAVLTGCSVYRATGTARSFCSGGLGRHRVVATDNAGLTYWGAWKPAGAFSMVFPLGGRFFVSAYLMRTS